MQVVTHIYTKTGPQAPVLMGGAGKGCFVLSLQPGDEGRIETTCDPIAKGQPLSSAQRVQWEPYEGGLAGAVAQITALRVVLTKLSGWAELRVEPPFLNQSVTNEEHA